MRKEKVKRDERGALITIANNYESIQKKKRGATKSKEKRKFREMKEGTPIAIA
ncbi:unnamed protein product, partial [Sphagnum compactum]